MTARNTTKFDVTPNLAAVGVTEFYFNNDTLAFEFTIVDNKGITSTVKTPEVTTEKKKLKKTDSIVRGIKKDLFPSIQQYEDSFLAIEENIEAQIEDSSEEIQDRVTAFKNNTNNDVEKSAATVLVELAMENIKQLFKDQYGYAFAVIRNDDHNEILKISDKNEKCKLYLGRLYYLTQGKTVNAESITNAIHTLQAEAIFNGEEITLDVRVAWSSPKREEIHYDMTDSQWRRIIITNQGWRISNDINPILFTRFNQKSQIEPDRTYPANIFDQFLDLMHIEGYNNRLLAKTWIITLLVPDIPHAIDLVFGTQGGAKSTFYKFVKRLVDPDKIELLSVPTQMMQFAQQMYHNYLAVYDNVKHIPKWFCDEICKATTGIGISKRTLFSDDDDTIYQYKRCIVINGINNVVVEPDALDRSIQMEHKRIKDENAKEDAEIKTRFEELRPKLFAYILDIVVKALDNKSKLSKITGGSMRMADSVYWGEAIARAMGEKPLAFANAYWENTGKQSANIIENHNLAQAIMNFVDTQCTPKDGDDNLLWVGKTADLLKELTSIAIQNKLYDDSTRKYWPKRVEGLTKRLRPIIPNLKTSLGISIDISTKIGTGRDKNLSYIEIRNEGHVFPEVLKSALPALPALPSTKIEENTQKEKQENDSNVQKKAELCLGSQSKAESEGKAEQPYQNKTALPEPPEICAQIDESKASKASKADLQIGGRMTPLDRDSTDNGSRSSGEDGSMTSLVSPVLVQEPSTAAPTAGGIMESYASIRTANGVARITNSNLEGLPAIFQGPHAAFDLEWERKATANSRQRILSFAAHDNLGNQVAYNIEDFNENNSIETAEATLLETFIFEVYEKYPLTFGFFSTMMNSETGAGHDSDLKILHDALEAHNLPQIVEFQREGWYKNCPYLVGNTHIDLGKVYSLQNVKTIYDGIYAGNGLDDVSEGLLNKTKYEGLEGADIDSMFPAIRTKYVARDAELTLELARYDDYRILKLMHSIAKKSKLSLPEVCHTTVSYWWSSFIRKEGLNSKLPSKLEKKPYPGARVLEAKHGFYREKTIVFDFGSMYPNIMKSYNLSPETICCECCVGDVKALVPDIIMDIINTWLAEKGLPSREMHYWTCQKHDGIVPSIITNLIAEKAQHKTDGNKSMETMVKLYINSFYGLFGDPTFPYSDYRLAELTTSYGKLMLSDMESMAEQHGYTVIGGDTDSIFVVNDAEGRKASLLAALGAKYPAIEVDSKDYRAMMITASKNYIAYPAEPTKNNPDMKPVVKGVKGDKSNESKWINGIQKFLVEHAVEGRDKIVEYLKSEYERFATGQIDPKLLRRKIQIHKEPSKYTNMCVEKIIGIAQGRHAEDTIWHFHIDKGKGKAMKEGWDKLSFEKMTQRYQNPDLISRDLYIKDLKTTFEKQFKYIGIDFDKDIINVGQ